MMTKGGFIPRALPRNLNENLLSSHHHLPVSCLSHTSQCDDMCISGEAIWFSRGLGLTHCPFPDTCYFVDPLVFNILVRLSHSFTLPSDIFSPVSYYFSATALQCGDQVVHPSDQPSGELFLIQHTCLYPTSHRIDCPMLG